MIIALGIYCGMAWMFMALTFYLVPGRKDFSDYLNVLFGPITLIIIVGYELWTSMKRKNEN